MAPGQLVALLFSLLVAFSQLGSAQPIRRQTPPFSGLSFANVVDYGSGGYYASSAVIADVNGDGKPDLLIGNQCITACGGGDPQHGAVGVLLGKGDGTFRRAESYDSGGYFGYAIAEADVNGDGNADVIVTLFCGGKPCYGHSRVGVLTGKGDGTFNPAVTFKSGGYAAESVAVGDLNGDGKLDIVVGNECVSHHSCKHGLVGVLLGKGHGTFRTVVPYATNGITTSLALADVNGDGKLDIVVANYCIKYNCPNHSSVTAGVLLGEGNGKFRRVKTYKAGGYGAASVAVADVNGDGKPDLIVASQCGSKAVCTDKESTVSVLLGMGNGTFGAPVKFETGGYSAYSVVVADVNQDGMPDLVVANGCASSGCTDNGSAAILLGNGDGTFQAAVTYDSGGWRPLSVAVGDLNGDGWPDIVLANDWVDESNLSGVVGVLINSSGTR